MRQLKLIWDFRGPDSEKIAEHHVKHLKDYIVKEKLSLNVTGVDVVNDSHTMAFMVVKESEMPSVRDVLKPHRGQVYNP
ncbi:hypothetical protein [Seonamhaeicola aphaedonensis]|uniref:YCII-related domain-containing protein n=1 Tax=Seonamhaeicola aphaedonensis TaxID=1461338 RepID=A0A3D9HD89_9FLAO|nr:hypothetical protein [Seonamhaeicola aphaedonensis]RED47430.1 hypothetical protein DFQ02_10657 [Seonamhaeicola aphaedonensis]